MKKLLLIITLLLLSCNSKTISEIEKGEIVTMETYESVWKNPH